MVGTLARIKKIERLEDGGIYVFSEGIGRFYIKDIKTEKPYLKAGVQVYVCVCVLFVVCCLFCFVYCVYVCVYVCV
jgi:prolipoprotein diacylglyceryltransferase